ncbi:hypothetical protein EDB85DRAFT_743102 [Lactarius pseudohatsudake]|nr:hypothetical protein EDB85DRAFT_743102 [Lactarius pseudohatsudake]
MLLSPWSSIIDRVAARSEPPNIRQTRTRGALTIIIDAATALAPSLFDPDRCVCSFRFVKTCQALVGWLACGMAIVITVAPCGCTSSSGEAVGHDRWPQFDPSFHRFFPQNSANRCFSLRRVHTSTYGQAPAYAARVPDQLVQHGIRKSCKPGWLSSCSG